MEPIGLIVILPVYIVYIGLSIVAIRKGHGMWVWWLLVPFVAIFAVPYAASRPAKPGSAAFRKFRPDDPRVFVSVQAYPLEAAGIDLELDDRGEKVVRIGEKPSQDPVFAVPPKQEQLTKEEQLANLESLHRIGVFTDEEVERFREHYRSLDDGETFWNKKL